jgi:formylglycine-generating enzyme required for sulfatase activity
MFQQHVVRQERERQRLVAEAKAAEERAMAEAKAAEERAMAEAKAAKERAMAEAKARVEAAEAELASKLKMSRPFGPGAKGEVGGVTVCWIPAGRYTMGSPEGEAAAAEDDASGPTMRRELMKRYGLLPKSAVAPGENGRFPVEVVHEVVLPQGVFLAETECTQVQWEVVMGTNPSNRQAQEDTGSSPPTITTTSGPIPSAMLQRYGLRGLSGGGGEGSGYVIGGAKKLKTSNSADRPVGMVSWGEAVEYCRKLTTKQRAEGILPDGWEWRLPTEAEWEYAARAGTTGLRHGELETIAWYDENSGSQAHPVKKKAANAWGLHDMLGNMLEWCSDWYGNYPTGSVTAPAGPDSGSNRVYRGGSWRDGPRNLRSAHRDGLDPGSRLDHLGFRPALSLVR